MALQAVEQHRLSLTRQRDELLSRLRARRDNPDQPPLPVEQPPREVSGRSAQTVLLVLGGLLVSVAALVFTVVSWGHLGIGGRTAVLLALTACALTLPLALRRRGLAATAEASGAVGLGLVLLDCYAARATGLAGLDTVNASGYWAVVAALVSVGALTYGWGLRMRFPLAAGFLLTRLPAPLFLSAAGVRQIQVYATAVVGAAIVDCVLLWLAGRAAARERLGGRALRRAATVFSAAWTLVGGALAVFASVTADQFKDAAWSWAPLGLLALLGLAVAIRHQSLPDLARRLAAGVSGVALVMAAGGTLRLLFAPGWLPVAYGLPAAVLVVIAAAILRFSRLQTAVGIFYSAALALLIAELAALPQIVRAVLQPLGQVPDTWAGTPVASWSWQVDPAALVALALLAAVLAAVTALKVTVAPTTLLETAAAAVEVLTATLLASGLPYGTAVATALLFAATASAVVALRRPRPPTITTLVVATVLALLWASADRTLTITALGVCAVLGTVLTWRTATRLPKFATIAAACTVLVLGTEAAAVGTTVGLSLPDTLLAVLTVAIATTPVATLTARTPHRGVSHSIEGAGYLLAVVALLLTVPHPGRLAFALAVSGVAALGVALRTDRRKAAAVAATVLLIGSSWIRLALWNVHTPEAYTLTVSAVALTIGQLRHRRDPAASSWSTYGPGLSIAMLPSLLAVWTDSHWLRPLLVGTAALVATVAGVRFRLQSPLLLGSITLLLTAVHELAPTVIQVLGLLPRWVPLGCAGLILLALGARYEQRLSDARRLRDTLRQLR